MKKNAILIVIGIVVIAVVAGTFSSLRNLVFPLSIERALGNIEWSEDYVTRRAHLSPSGGADLAATLPSIDTFSMVVNPRQRSNQLRLEVFSSSEKAGKGDDGWLVEATTAFNKRNITNVRKNIAIKAQMKVPCIRKPIGEGRVGFLERCIAKIKWKNSLKSPNQWLWSGKNVKRFKKAFAIAYVKDAVLRKVQRLFSKLPNLIRTNNDT